MYVSQSFVWSGFLKKYKSDFHEIWHKFSESQRLEIRAVRRRRHHFCDAATAGYNRAARRRAAADSM